MKKQLIPVLIIVHFLCSPTFLFASDSSDLWQECAQSIAGKSLSEDTFLRLGASLLLDAADRDIDMARRTEAVDRYCQLDTYCDEPGTFAPSKEFRDEKGRMFEGFITQMKARGETGKMLLSRLFLLSLWYFTDDIIFDLYDRHDLRCIQEALLYEENQRIIFVDPSRCNELTEIGQTIFTRAIKIAERQPTAVAAIFEDLHLSRRDTSFASPAEAFFLKIQRSSEAGATDQFERALKTENLRDPSYVQRQLEAEFSKGFSFQANNVANAAYGAVKGKVISFSYKSGETLKETGTRFVFGLGDDIQATSPAFSGNKFQLLSSSAEVLSTATMDEDGNLHFNAQLNPGERHTLKWIGKEE